MGTFWKASTRDKVRNGTILGGLLGVAIIWGEKIYGFIEGVIPADWIFLGDLSIPLYIIGVGALIGYVVDKW